MKSKWRIVDLIRKCVSVTFLGKTIAIGRVTKIIEQDN